MKRKMIALLIATVLFGSFAHAQDEMTLRYSDLVQNAGSARAIRIGQQVPDSNIERIIHYAKRSAKLSDFKGKMLILDFWHQYCGSCLETFPKLEALQRKFGDSIVILPVTFQSEGSIKNFLADREEMGLPMRLPSVVEDTMLHQMFPHKGDPHEVWIGPDGRVKAITHSYAVTDSTVRAVLSGRPVNLPEKRQQSGYDRQRPLLVNGNGGTDSAFIYRSIFTRYNDSIEGTETFSSPPGVKRVLVVNQQALSMYRTAYSMTPFGRDFLAGDPHFKYIACEVRDRDRLVIPRFTLEESSQTAIRQNLFTYELIVPSSYSREELLDQMIGDLERFFRLKSGVEERTVNCLALVRVRGRELIKTAGGPPRVIGTKDRFRTVEKNQPMSALVRTLNGCLSTPVVVDATDYTGGIDFELGREDLVDLSTMRSALSKYGLDLVPAQKKIKMLVLRDR